MVNETTRYPSLNGLRGLSIILVIINHLCIYYHIFDGLNRYYWLKPLTLFLQDGQLAVNIFFVISGFLITSLMLREEQLTQTVSLKKYYIRRTLRIFPAYYFLLFVYFILDHYGFIQISEAAFVTAVTYTKYFNWQLDWFTSHAWSLSIEEHFYLVWPLMFIRGNKIRKQLALLLVFVGPIARTYVHYHSIPWITEFSILIRIDSIALGCVFALFRNEIIEKVHNHWNLLFYSAALSLFFLRYLPILTTELNVNYILIPLGGTCGIIANILIAIIMMYSVFGPKMLWFKFLNLKLLNYIGILSYSIYLWQQIFINWLGYWPMIFPLNLVCIFAMAMFSYYVIEKPFLKLKAKLTEREDHSVLE